MEILEKQAKDQRSSPALCPGHVYARRRPFGVEAQSPACPVRLRNTHWLDEYSRTVAGGAHSAWRFDSGLCHQANVSSSSSSTMTLKMFSMTLPTEHRGHGEQLDYPPRRCAGANEPWLFWLSVRSVGQSRSRGLATELQP